MDVDLAIKMTADATDASRAFDDVAGSAKAMASDVDTAAAKADGSMSTMADSADHLGSSSSQAAGGLGDLGGALSAVPGPLGAVGTGMESLAPLVMGVTGATDLMNLALNSNVVVNARAKAAAVASAIATKAQTAVTKAAAIGQWALNAAMSANPVGIVVVAIAALVAGLILAYNKSETFRNIVKGAMDTVKTAVGKVVGAVDDIKTAIGNVIKKAPDLGAPFDTVMGLIKGYIDIVTTPMQTLLTLIKDVVDWVGRIDFPEPPGWLKDLPGVPGRSATGGGLTGSLSSDLRNGASAAAAGGLTLVNIELQTLDLKGTALRDLVQALRREGVSLGGAVLSS